MDDKEGVEHNINAISKSHEQIVKVSYERPVSEKEPFSPVATRSEEMAYRSFYPRTFDVPKMFNGEIKQSENARPEHDKFIGSKSLSFMNIEEFKVSPDCLDVEEPFKTSEDGPFSQVYKSVNRDIKDWGGLPWKGYDEEEKEVKLLVEEPINTMRFKEDGPQKVEKVEKPQTQPLYEIKRINMFLEEGSVRLMLSGDRLRLSINLKEDLYMQPTAFEIQKLVQSLHNLGLNLEVLKLNGSSLYSSDQRHGQKKEDRERAHQLSLPEFKEENPKSFSLYL